MYASNRYQVFATKAFILSCKGFARSEMFWQEVCNISFLHTAPLGTSVEVCLQTETQIETQTTEKLIVSTSGQPKSKISGGGAKLDLMLRYTPS